MGCLLIWGIYLLAAFALYLLWSTDYRLLWWAVAGSTVLMFITQATVKTAYRMLMAQARPMDMFDAFMASEEAKQHKVLKFWAKVSLVFVCLTAVLSVVGLVLALSGKQ